MHLGYVLVETLFPNLLSNLKEGPGEDLNRQIILLGEENPAKLFEHAIVSKMEHGQWMPRN